MVCLCTFAFKSTHGQHNIDNCSSTDVQLSGVATLTTMPVCAHNHGYRSQLCKIAAGVSMLLSEMQDALDPVWKLHQQKHLTLRTAAFVYALENVIKVAKARGYGG